MSYSVNDTSISLTRGDTFSAIIRIMDSEGSPYIPQEGDSIRFAMKSSYLDAAPLLVKDIPISTMRLVIEPQDTRDFAFGKYVYDVQLTKSTGEVDTFITKGKFTLTEEVY